MQISGRVFLVTGASSGLGAATAALLEQKGARVALADLRYAEPGSAESGSPANRLQLAMDVCDPLSVGRGLDTCQLHLGGLSGLVHCAGVIGGARLFGKKGVHDLESFRRVVEVNLIGSFNMARLVAERLAAAAPQEDGERGVMVFTSSVAAWDAQAGQTAYAASKGGVASMMLPMARDLAPAGIRCVAIAPGAFETPMMAGLPENVRSGLLDQIPFPRRLGKPEEFAALAAHAIENAMLNGCTLRLDGGLRMPAR